MRLSFLLTPALVAILSLAGIESIAQKKQKAGYSVKGKILDATANQPVAYATITVLQQDSAITTTYSNEEGLFTVELEAFGSYRIEITSVGYEIRTFDAIVQENNAVTVLENILLVKSAKSLEEISVIGRRKLIDLRPGMLIYNAENDLSLKGGTAADVLRKAPVLNVDAQGNVSMRGSRNLKILINGKYSGQVARNPADALNMMPANNIRSVEVITTPSAKYDAEGAAGVINIITKKGGQQFSGALELTASNMEQAINPRIGANGDKWNLNIHGHAHRLRFKEAYQSSRTQYQNSIPAMLLKQEMNKDNSAPHGNMDMAFTYTPDSSSEVSVGANLWVGKWPDNYAMFTSFQVLNGGLPQEYNQSTAAANQYMGADLNVAFNKKFQKPGHEVTLLAQFSPNKAKSPYRMVQWDEHHNKLYSENNDNRDNNREWTFQADYLYPFSDRGVFSLESGLKMILRNATSRYYVTASSGDNELAPIPDRSDLFSYSQHVGAAYSMLKANLKKNWYAEAGVRLEQTFFDGNIRDADTHFKNEFINFIPTATISRKVNDDQTFSLSYTERLTRPYIWDLNPNKKTSDPKNITVGNPDLKPEIAHQAEFTYGFYPTSNFFLNSAIFWKQTNNAMLTFTSTDAAGVATTTKQNLAVYKTYGLNLSAMATINLWWSANGNINIEYLDFNSNALDILNRGWGTHLNLNSTFKLPSNYTIQAFGEYNTRKIKLQGYETSRYLYSVSGKKEFPAKKIALTLALLNPFSGYLPQTEVIQTTDFFYELNNRYYNRAFKLTLNWEFGGITRQQKSRRIRNEDVKGLPRG
ncbi:MAG: TonB-dependent receptor [Chitinophagaceae bacterium]|nr:TonB-dependent receptor [Chitinophagaceae bacterium]